MKKIYLIPALIIALSQTTHAQETDLREKPLLGLKIGANYSNVYDSQGEQFNADPKAGLAAGAFVAVPIGKYVGLQPEILLSQKGFQATGRILGGNYTFTRTTTFIDVPLLISLKPSEFITIMVGPQYSYLINQKDVFETTSITSEQETEFNNDNIRRNILCFTGGADITIKHIVLGGRVGWDLQNNNGNGTSSTPRYRD